MFMILQRLLRHRTLVAGASGVLDATRDSLAGSRTKEAGDAGVLDTDRHDAVELAAQVYDECRTAVDRSAAAPPVCRRRRR